MNATANYRSLLYLIIGLLNIAAFGCQPTVYLMPTPAIMATGEINPFNINPNLEESNRVDVLFATNRTPMGDDDNRNYTTFPGNKLRMGIAHFTIGSKETDLLATCHQADVAAGQIDYLC